MLSHLLRAVALIVALAQTPMTLPFTGIVTDTAGKPLSGVRVVSWPAEDTRTDASGRYTLAKPRDLVRFSLAGYRPVTKLFSSLTAPVSLEAVMERPVSLAECPDALKKDKRQADMSLRVALPRQANGKIKSAVDADSRVVALGYRVDWMVHGSGPHWSPGMPELKLWKQLIKSEERDILVDANPQVTIADYSGMLQDGSHFRFIGLPGESLSYTDATVDSAQYFDSVLETLCWSAR